jgi:hypothetical protein
MNKMNCTVVQWFIILTILSRVRVTLDGVLDWRLDLLTTLTHDSWQHLIIARSLISTFYKSLQHTPSLFSLLCLHQSIPGNGFQQWGFFNCTDQVRPSQTPIQMTLLQLTSKLVSVITSRLGPRRKHRLLLYPNRFHGNVFVCEGVTQ